jgi:WD40 repeat protein
VRQIVWRVPPDLSYFTAFTSDSRRLVVVRSEHAEILDLQTGREVGRWRVPLANLVGTQFGFSGSNYLASANGHRVSVIDLRTGKTAAALRTSPARQLSVTVSGDERWCATWDRQARSSAAVWDLVKGEKRFEVQTHRAVVSSIAFSPDGHSVAVGQTGAIVSVWDLGLRTQSARLETACEAPQVAYYPGNTRLAVAGKNGIFEEWNATDATTYRRTLLLRDGRTGTMLIAFPGRGVRLCAAIGHAFSFRDIPDAPPLPRLGFHQHAIDSMRFLGNEKLVSASREGRVCAWDLRTGTMTSQTTFTAPFSLEQFSCMAISQDGRFVLAGSQVRDMATGEPRLTVGADPLFSRGEISHSLVACADHSSLNVWDLARAATVWKTRHPLSEIMATAFCDSGTLLAITRGQPALDRTVVTVYEAATGESRFTKIYGYNALSLAFSHDGRVLAVGSGADVNLYSTASGILLKTLALPARPLTSLGFSPDDRLLAVATAASDGGSKLNVIELRSAQRRCQFGGHDGAITCLAFSPHGRTVVSGGADTSILVWNLRGAGKPALALSQEAAETAWRDLQATDPSKVQRAIVRLVESPAEATALVRKNLPAPSRSTVEKAVVQMLISNLANEDFKIREKASLELARLGAAVAADLRAAQKSANSLEISRRVGRVLEKLDALASSPENLRKHRAIEILETLGTIEATELLRIQASGRRDDPLTVDAERSLERLNKGGREAKGRKGRGNQ